MRSRYMSTILLLAALVVATVVLVLPATASADGALAATNQECAFFFGGKAYVGTGTQVITPNGDVVLVCRLTLASGTPVARPTETTIGNCEILETPSGEARASCHYEL